MKLNLIKEKLEKLQSQKGTSKYAEHLWRPKVGRYTVRILPAAWNKDFPFKEIFFHYGVGSRTMLALTNFGEEDPIAQFAENLRKGEYDVENYKLSKKLEPKMRVFVPIIDRDDEAGGVKLWGFGKEIYNELLALAEDEDVGDYTDVYDGRDITVTISKQEGKTFNSTSIRVKTKTSQLSEDAKQVKEWLTNQPDPLSIFDRVEYAELKKALVEWLTPEEDEEDEDELQTETGGTLPKDKSKLPWEDEGAELKSDDDEEEEEEEDETPKSKSAKGGPYKLSNAKKKPNVDEALKKLFPEKK